MTPGGGQMEGGNLKLSIALGQKPTIIQKGPFYLMKQEAIPASEITGATNLMASKGLEHSYIKLTSKEQTAKPITAVLDMKSNAIMPYSALLYFELGNVFSFLPLRHQELRITCKCYY